MKVKAAVLYEANTPLVVEELDLMILKKEKC
ncbi:MAG: hypothetical protein CM1200mP15_20680 [Dehalococcoidia bacterium]|nr:MAG: hypothetical protein CM1200mP15_20680 [Dehalococcoidia bacterium]